jgi:hypothetical protein
VIIYYAIDLLALMLIVYCDIDILLLVVAGFRTPLGILIAWDFLRRSKKWEKENE